MTATRFPDSIESRASWVAAAITTAILAISYGAPLLVVVGLKPITASLGTERSVVALAGALVWGLTDHSSPYDRSGDGCVTVAFPSSMGGGLEHACGGAAHDWCRAVDGQRDAHAVAVQAQCRVAGIRP